MSNFIIVFFNSFLSFFGLVQNPIETAIDERKEIRDADNLAGDWHKVGQYISGAYEKCKQAGC